MVRDVQKDAENYVRCMTELNGRFSLFDWSVEDFVGQNLVLLGPAESAFLQLRKCYELVVFATMAWNLPQMIENWSKFEKDWNLATIVNRIQKQNSDFLPHTNVPREDPRLMELELKLMSDTAPFRIDAEKLKMQHGKLGKLLHARNPFAEKINYQAELAEALAAKSELQVAMSEHVTFIGVDGDILVTKMNRGDGKAESTPLRRIHES